MTSSAPPNTDSQIQWHIDNHLTHQIHTSERKAFRACRRRWNWVYRDMYAPTVTPEPLEFGVAFHRAMELFYEPRTWRSSLEVRTDLALVAFKQECDKHLRQYKKINPDPDIEIIKSYEDRTKLGLGMIRYYCQTMSPHYDHRWTPIRVEVSFEVPLQDPNAPKHCKRSECDVCEKEISKYQLWCKCSLCRQRWFKYTGTMPREDPHGIHSDWRGLPVTYGGRLDALFQDEIGRYWIADWKTTARLLDEDQESSFLQLDDQVASYLWALSKYGINCAGFVYVEIKKVTPQAPELLSRTYKGRKVSTNKQLLTTPSLFRSTVQKLDLAGWQMGLYNEHLQWLESDGPKFTQRHQIHKNEHEIEEVGRVVALEAMDMIGQPSVYPMPGRFSCNWCLFKQPCLGVNMGEDYQYTLDTMFEKRTKFYWEEKQASTE